MMRKIKQLRQLIPTKFATGCGEFRGGDTPIPTFITWWMWLGRSFKVKRTDLVWD